MNKVKVNQVLKIGIAIYFLLMWGSNSLFSQAHRIGPENFFGVQVKPLIPMHLVGDKPIELNEGVMSSTVYPALGYSFGGMVRVGMTKLLAIETGLNYSKRNYKVDFEVADSNLVANDDFGFINFEVPINLLVYIQLGQQLYMNVAGGGSLNFNPSNVQSRVNIPGTPHLFTVEGKRLAFFDFNLNAEVGFEYRTERAGTFYLGMAGRIPFRPVMAVATEYRWDTQKNVAYGLIEGATFNLTLKYFFHNQNHRWKPLREYGPIEN